MNRRIMTFLVLLLLAGGPAIYGQSAIVLLDSTHVKVSSITAMTTTHYKSVMVLDKSGAKYADFICATSSTRSLKNLKYNIIQGGKTGRSFGKKDIVSTELSENMADDYTTHYLEAGYPTYPYTVEMEYQIEYTDGYISMPTFAPAYYMDVAVMKAVYHLQTPENTGYSYKAVNTGSQPLVYTEKGQKHTIWKLEGLKPYKADAFMPPAESVLPHVYIVPHNFSYYKTQGNSSSWSEYGKWQWGLMEGRDILPDKLKKIVHNLTDTIPARRDKIRALYKYLGENTRYVSIQLGLGGLQPMSAEEVYSYGFGDCKALSNYLKAMLKECGIESNYVEINTNNPVIFKDHASTLQTNHAILKVPDPHGDLWLECTNTDIPLGFLHSGIAGHDAVVYSNGTAAIETLPDYPDTTNIINTDLRIEVSEEGVSSITVKEEYLNSCSASLLGLSGLDKNRQADFVKGEIAAPSCTVSEMEIREEENPNPAVHLSYNATSADFISRSGNRMFIPLSVFRASMSRPAKERELDIYVRDGHVWKQKITIGLPSGYRIEGIPKSTGISCCMGHFKLISETDEGKVHIEIERSFSSGTYSSSKAGEIWEFFSFIEKIYNQKIIICRI